MGISAAPALDNALTATLKLLNSDVEDNYALVYNPWLGAWQVVRYVRLNADQQTFKRVPFSASHVSAAAALHDALILKLAAVGVAR